MNPFQQIHDFIYSQPNPTWSVKPIATFTQITGCNASEHVQLMIEARGADGSYSRCFTNREMWSKSI